MTDDGRLRALFDRALDIDPEARGRFLDETCGSDLALRRELEELLAIDGRAGDFLETRPTIEPEPLPTSLGPWLVETVLGRGGMGIVYRARHRESGEAAAVKTVAASDPALLHGIRREIQALARIRLPGVVSILDEGVEEGVPWYAMQLVAGPTLLDHARTLVSRPRDGSPWFAAVDDPGRPEAAGGALEPLLRLILKLTETLAQIHGLGIVHRDLKPDNVVVTEDGWPVLLDLGLNLRFRPGRDTLQADGVGLGSAPYVAPEQAAGELVDARADLYSLGCILFELVTGEPPHGTDNAADILKRRYLKDPPAMSLKVSGVPPALDELARNLLARDPRRRIGYAADAASTLARLSGRTEPPDAPALPYLYRARLRGRGQSLDLFARLMPELSNGAGALVLLGGETGVGKTRLALEVAAMGRQHGFQVHMGECPPPLRRDGGERASPLQALRSVLATVALRCRAGGEETRHRYLADSGQILGLYEPDLSSPEAGELPEELPLSSFRGRLFRSLARALRELARESPNLLILDDVQWADELTIGFLARVPLESLGANLVVIVHRTDEPSDALATLKSLDTPHRIVLPRLDESAVEAMVGDMLAMEEPPRPLVRMLAEHSEGNPLFVAEYLRASLEEGLLVRDDRGRWREADPSESTDERLGLPPTLADLVRRRLSGLDDASRTLLAAASVLGSRVEGFVLDEVAQLENPNRTAAVASLEARELLKRDDLEHLRFTHDIVREVAYGQIPASDRRRFHRRAAEALSDRNRWAEQALHWERAGARELATEAYLMAARDAERRFAQQEAERLYRSYLGLCDVATEESVAARIDLAMNILRPQGRNDEAVQMFLLALSDARTIGDRTAEVASLRALGVVNRDTGRLDEALLRYESALKVARDVGDRSGERNTLSSLANLLKLMGRTEEAHQSYRDALALARESGNGKSEAIVLGNLGNLHLEQGRADEAESVYEQALRIHRELGNVALEAAVLGNLGHVYLYRNRHAEARRLYDEALDIHRRVGDRRSEGMVLGSLARVSYMQDQPEEAKRLYQEAIALSREVGDRFFEGIAMGDLGILLKEEGRSDEARALLSGALDIHRATGYRRSAGITLVNLAALAMDDGELERAEGLFREALAILREVGERRWEGKALLGLAQPVLWREGVAPARELVHLAEAAAVEVGDHADLANVLILLGHLALAAGQSATAFLARAEEQARDATSGDRRGLANLMEALQKSNQAWEAGRELVRGYLPSQVPPGVEL